MKNGKLWNLIPDCINEIRECLKLNGKLISKTVYCQGVVAVSSHSLLLYDLVSDETQKNVNMSKATMNRSWITIGTSL